MNKSKTTYKQEIAEISNRIVDTPERKDNLVEHVSLAVILTLAAAFIIIFSSI